MARRRVIAVFTLAALAALGGCGDDEPAPPPPPEAQVAATWQRAMDAALTGDGETFCALAAPGAREQLTARTQLPCPDAIRVLQVRLTERDRATLRAATPTITVSGERAVVRYETAPALARLGFTGRTRLERVAGAWRLLGI